MDSLHPALVADILAEYNRARRGVPAAGPQAPQGLTLSDVPEPPLPPDIQAELLGAVEEPPVLGDGPPPRVPSASHAPAAPSPSLPDPEQPAFSREPELLYIRFNGNLSTLHTSTGSFPLTPGDTKTLQKLCVAAIRRAIKGYAKAMQARYNLDK